MRPKLIKATLLCFLLAAVLQADNRFATEEEIATARTELSQLESEAADAQWSARLEDLKNELIYLEVKMKKHREGGGEGTGVTLSEVEELRGGIGELRADIRHAAQRESGGLSVVPAGAELSVRLLESLSTATAQQGDRFSAATMSPFIRSGDVLIPEGAILKGVIELVDRPESRTDRGAKLILGFDSVEIDGRTYPLNASVIGASEKMETGLGDEKAKMGVGAGIGAVLGAVIGGKKGALAGVILGGSGAILATEGKDVELPRGTILNIMLDRELALPIDTP
jgi:hypothetical protein